jgi:protein-disulfide isomerase
MKRILRGAAAALCVLLGSGCADGVPEPERTDDLTRSLLDQATVTAGPSTAIPGELELPGEVTRAYLPELGFNLGLVEAPVKVIEFSDFGCGYCRRFHQETFPTLATQFISTGMIEWKFLPFIAGMFDNSLAVTEAAECTLEQDAVSYGAFGDMLWDRQPEWKESGDPAALVRGWAADLGLDMGRYDSCLAEDRRLERVAGATVAAEQLGVRGTPTFWIVGYGPIQGALPLEAFQGILGTVYQEVMTGQQAVPPIVN